MDTLANLTNIGTYNTAYKITPVFDDSAFQKVQTDDNGFGAILNSAIQMVDETNAAQNTAQDEEIKFALGQSNNTHDLMIAEQKAAIALQFTVAVRDRFLQGYNTIMNMQI